MKKKAIQQLTKLKNTIEAHYKEFQVVDGISVWKSDLLDEMIAKEKEEVAEIEEVIQWIKDNCPSWFDRMKPIWLSKMQTWHN